MAMSLLQRNAKRRHYDFIPRCISRSAASCYSFSLSEVFPCRSIWP